jgi:hypothetical protein
MEYLAGAMIGYTIPQVIDALSDKPQTPSRHAAVTYWSATGVIAGLLLAHFLPKALGK